MKTRLGNGRAGVVSRHGQGAKTCRDRAQEHNRRLAAWRFGNWVNVERDAGGGLQQGHALPHDGWRQVEGRRCRRL